MTFVDDGGIERGRTQTHGNQKRSPPEIDYICYSILKGNASPERGIERAREGERERGIKKGAVSAICEDAAYHGGSYSFLRAPRLSKHLWHAIR